MNKLSIYLFLLAALTACSQKPVINNYTYSPFEYPSLSQLNTWYFEGRLAYQDTQESFTANISWKHLHKEELIELSGPFGQGRTIFEVTDHSLKINNGNQTSIFKGNIDQQISNQLNMNIPVSALKYWVLGLTKPDQNYELTKSGFHQADWTIEYSRMKSLNNVQLPEKLKLFQDGKQLKLIITQWQLN